MPDVLVVLELTGILELIMYQFNSSCGIMSSILVMSAIKSIGNKGKYAC